LNKALAFRLFKIYLAIVIAVGLMMYFVVDRYSKCYVDLAANLKPSTDEVSVDECYYGIEQLNNYQACVYSAGSVNVVASLVHRISWFNHNQEVSSLVNQFKQACSLNLQDYNIDIQ